jgi:hypothetical protein
MYQCATHGLQGMALGCDHIRDLVRAGIVGEAVEVKDEFGLRFPVCLPCARLYGDISTRTPEAFHSAMRPICGGCFKHWRDMTATAPGQSGS